MKKTLSLIVAVLCGMAQAAQAADAFVSFSWTADAVCLTDQQGEIVCDPNDWKGVQIAVGNLKADLQKVTGRSNYPIVVGTLGKSKAINQLAKKKLIDAKALQGKREKFIITQDAVKLVEEVYA